MKDLFLNAKKVDLFGKNYSFEENENQRFTTIVGNIATSLVVIVCVVIGFLFGQEVYLRETPTVIVSEDSLDYSRVYFREYPIMLSVSRADGSQILNSNKLFSFQIVKYNLDNNLKASYEIFNGLEKCNPDNYDKKFQSLIKKTLDDNEKAGTSKLENYCPNSTLFVQNSYTSLNSTFISINFLKCNPEVRECLPDLDKIAKDVYVHLFTYNYYIDPKNYSNPIKLEQTVITQQLSDMLSKRLYFNIGKEKLVTNKGWLLENIIEEEFFTTKNSIKDVNPNFDRKMYTITISSPAKRSITYRKYMKIQDLLASIGGFFNILFLIVFVIIKHYVDYSYYISLLLNYKKNSHNPHFYKDLHSLDPTRGLNKQEINSNQIEVEFQKEKLQLFSLLRVNKVFNDSSKINIFEKENFQEPTSKLQNNFILNNKEELSTNKLKKEIPNELKDIAKFYEVDNNVSTDDKNNYFDKVNYFNYLWNDLVCKKSKIKHWIKVSRSLMSFHDIIELNLKEHYK